MPTAQDGFADARALSQKYQLRSCDPHALYMFDDGCIYIVYLDWMQIYSPTVQDRFADARARPPVDSQQDWTLVAGKEENGWTIVSFSRALQTGDARDRDIVQVHTRMQLCMYAC